MVHIKDEGSHFDVPIETLWAFLQADDDHGRSHSKTTRNHEMKELGENSMLLSMEQNMNGQWVKVANRITVYPPLAVAIEVVGGPMTGSKILNIYTPKGNKTAIDVYGDFMAPSMPPAQIEPAVRANLEQVFNEDSAALREFASKK